MNQSTDADITKAAIEGVTKALIESVIKPIITNGLHGLRNLKDTALDLFVDRLSGYIEDQYKRHSLLNTIVFGNKKRLEDLYLPLTVVEESHSFKNSIEYKIDGFNENFLPTVKYALITDTAGMGKSTLSKYLFLQCIKSKKYLPVFVELRQLSKETPIIKFIEKQFNNATDPTSEGYISQKRIERIIKTGGFCFFFDGYDEIPSKEREFVTKNLKDFSEKYSNNIFIITSRPENSLAAFPQFSRFSIKPLKKNESYDLIKKYDQDGERSHQLIEKLEGGMFSSVEDFLKNPLLTTLLYRCFEYKQQIPLKKHIFYRQVFDALYDWHDSTKDGYNSREKKSNLDQDSFHKILRILGFISVMNGTVEGDADTVLGWIRQAKNSCNGYTFSESNFLSDVINAVPVFVKDGLYYRWSHKSLAEYFSAQYICNEGKLKQDEILTTILNSGETIRFTNVLDQIYDIDHSAFKKNLTHPTVRAFISHFNSGLNSFKNNSDISIKELELRLAASFGCELFLIKELSTTNELKKLSTQKSNRRARENQPFTFPNMNIWGLSQPKSSDNQIKYAVLITDGFGVITDLLASKKDPLINRLSRNFRVLQEIAKQIKPEEKNQNAPIKINNQPQEPFNQKNKFNLITDLYIFIREGFIDKKQAEEFLENFTAGEPGLSLLTDSLLSNFSSKP